jgi:hypothetical protein
VLVEKPVASTAEQAAEMVDLAAVGNALQVGHVERFNAALDAVRPFLARPRFIEAVRGEQLRFPLDGYRRRARPDDCTTSTSVLSLVNQSVVEVSAFGCTAVGPHEDFAQARVAVRLTAASPI